MASDPADIGGTPESILFPKYVLCDDNDKKKEDLIKYLREHHLIIKKYLLDPQDNQD